MRLTAIGWVLASILVAGAARADVVVVVSAESPIETLSRTALAEIYLGRRDRFPGGVPVTPIDQQRGSPAYEAFYGEYLGRSTAQVTAHWSRLIFTGRGRPPRAVPDDGAAADVVAENPGAIGYVDRGRVDERLRVVQIE